MSNAVNHVKTLLRKLNLLYRYIFNTCKVPKHKHRWKLLVVHAYVTWYHFCF